MCLGFTTVRLGRHSKELIFTIFCREQWTFMFICFIMKSRGRDILQILQKDAKAMNSENLTLISVVFFVKAVANLSL